MSTEKVDVGVVLTGMYSTRNTNHPDWAGRVVFWGKFGWTPNFREARIIEVDDGMDFVGHMNDVYRNAFVHKEDVEANSISFNLLSLSLEFLNWNEGDILERRQALAIGKLSQDEIEALGIKSLAAYHKLKS